MAQITTANWGQAPHNRLSFLQVQQLFPTARVRRGPGPISELKAQPGSAEPVVEVIYTDPEGRQRSVADMLACTHTDAFLVAKHGSVLSEHYFGGMAVDSLHLLNSVTKSLVGMLAGIQISSGCFAPDDQVSDYLPELAQGPFQRTTVRHLLDMTAAVKFGEDYTDPQADFWIETAVVGWRPSLVNAQTSASLAEHAVSLRQVEQADGEKYHYRTILTNVLGMVIQRTAGKPLQEVLEDALWSKLGAEQDLAIVVDRTGFPYVGAGGNACARDLARFGQLLVQEGQLGGEQIVPTDWIDDTRQGTDTARAQLAAREYADLIPGGHYRNQMWVQDAERGVMAALEIYGQTIHLNMTTGVVIVKLSSHPEPADMAVFANTLAAMDAISNAV